MTNGLEALSELVTAAQGGDWDGDTFGQIISRFQDMVLAGAYVMLVLHAAQGAAHLV